MATFYAWTTMNLPTSSRYMSPPMGKDSQEDNRIPFPVKSGNGSTRMNISQRTTLWAMPKTLPVEDALQSTALQSTDDDDDDDEGIF